MKRQVGNKINMISFQIVSILLLVSAMLLFVFVFLSKQTNTLQNKVEYKFVQEPLKVNTDTIKQGNLSKVLRLDGITIRASNIIQSINLGKAKNIKCAIGSIINSATDISDDIDQGNFYRGRVANIENEGEDTIVYIDLASNYIVQFELSDSYHDILQDIIAGNLLMTIQSNYEYLDYSFSEVDYNFESCNYILTYQLQAIDEFTYPSRMMRVTVREYDYFNATYVELRIIKNITIDYVMTLDRVVLIENDRLITEEIKVQILDAIDNKVIIEAVSYAEESFIIYNRYNGVTIE